MRIASFALTLLLVASSAHALVLCRMPDGRTYAGDKPPPDCEVKSQYTDSAPPEAPIPQEEPGAGEADRKAANANATEIQSLATRRRIEADANRAADELADTRAKLSRYASTVAGADGLVDPTTRAILRDESLEALRIRERDLLKQIDDHKAQFAELTSRLAQARGSLPASWPRAFRCDRCP